MAVYSGCVILQPLADLIGLPIDQVNFVLCELLALVLSIPFRNRFHPKWTSSTVRHAVVCSIGLGLGFFCFGQQMFHMITMSGLCYLILHVCPSQFMHQLVFAVAMTYMSLMHMYRMYYDYGGYVLDVTGPLMICTQKVTTVAFCLHDGMYKDKKKLTADQTQQAIRGMPSPLVYFSYIFYFQGILAGPLVFFAEYIAFIEGTNFRVERPGKQGSDEEYEEPSPARPVAFKLLACVICLAVTLGPSAIYPKVTNADKEFIANHGFSWRFCFLLISVSLARARYYFAWKLGEAVNNASGLGFNGYDANGKPKWDLIKNVHIRKLETATSLKTIIDSWNVQTAIWLRRICYDRAPFSRTLLTYVLSAVWHGFYPGYFFTFIGATFFTMAARSVRRNIRPSFQRTPATKLFYDIVTWFFAQLSLAYLIVPFTILEFWPTFYYYHYSMHWFLHIAVGLVLIAMPPKSTRPYNKPTDASKSSDNSRSIDSSQPMPSIARKSSGPDEVAKTIKLIEMERHADLSPILTEDKKSN